MYKLNPQSLIHRTLLIPAYFAAPVFVEDAETEADGSFFLRVRTEAGGMEQINLTPEEIEAALNSAPSTASRVVSASDQSLLIEAERIRLAYAYDPHFAVSLSGVEPLPHQIEAVYERMLPQARLRFLLADDPGAGKTIMAGLLIKELKMRNAIDRVLVLCPAPLTLQWQDEMRSKFDEVFEVVRADMAKDQLAGSVWQRFPQCITSIDFAKRDEVVPDLLRADWDLVIIDEAHKCAARWFGNEVKRTKRYQLAETLSQQSERLLLLTATPHSGNSEQFAYFLRLLDEDQFVGPDRVEEYAELNQQALMSHEGSASSPWFLRRTKEELRTFDGEKLFTLRHAITVPFELSEAEHRLYHAVTDYINTYLPRQSGSKKAPIALARTVLQRRLASSMRAIRRSLERRFERFGEVLREVERLPVAKREAYLHQQNLLDDYDEEQDSDDADDVLNEDAAIRITAAERISDLSNEVQALEMLVKQARQVETMGDERKLTALLTCLKRAEFKELADGRGKLLIFTEHKDTLDYLKEKLSSDYACVEIHGGMNAQRRRDAQEQFRTTAQICLATDAAGEGINLQFCHLMINYDLPWNPMRLEQRMGRVHRIGQKLDVFIFNFVATNTVEGHVLQTLLLKLEDIRHSLGDRVFDVIGLILRLNGVDLEDILREAAYNPRHIDDAFYTRQIEHIDAGRLRELEQATGVAMATSHVDLGRIQQQDFRSEERRLMPEYVEKYFLTAANKVGLKVEQRADTLYRVEYVSQTFRSPLLNSVKRFGTPWSSFKKLTFTKSDILHNPMHADAELLSPGHPLFATVSEVLETKLASVRGGLARYSDPLTEDSYRLHFFVTELVGEEPLSGTYRTVPQHAALAVLLEPAQGELEIAPPDILHDLQPLEPTEGKEELANTSPLDPAVRQKLERFIQRTFQRALLDDQRTRREREISIRRSYLERTFESLLNALKRKYWDLSDKAERNPQYRIARDEAGRRIEELEQKQTAKLEALKHLRVLRSGRVRYLGSAEVDPVPTSQFYPESTPGAGGLRTNPEVEQRAMAFVMDHERARGWTPEDISSQHDGSGFDIRSLGPADGYGKRPVRRIEVKGRSGYQQPVLLTANEWLQAGRHTDSYWLYVIWGSGEGQIPQLLTIQNPAAKLARAAQPIVKYYLLSAEAIQAAGE